MWIPQRGQVESLGNRIVVYSYYGVVLTHPGSSAPEFN